MLWCT